MTKLILPVILCLVSQLVRADHSADTSYEYTSLVTALKDPGKVRVLNLHDQGLTTLPDSLAMLTNLEVLDISINNFTEIPPVVFRLSSLKKLRVSGAYSYIDMFEEQFDHLLQVIPPEIGNLENLEVLILDHNLISEIPAAMLKLTRLKDLSLFRNSLTPEDLEMLYQLNSLETLDIGGNEIDSLPETFSQLSNLKTLYLDNAWAEGAPVGTCFEKFPPAICRLKKLEALYMRGQCITEVPKQIGELQQLKELNLYANQFTWLPDEITKLAALEILNVDALCLGEMSLLCNKTFYFPKDMNKLSRLKELVIESRLVSENEKQRLKKALPGCELK